MNSKFISVLVPVYNQEKYIKECLDSLDNQTYDNYEVVVLNDGSTDGTAEVLKQYENNPKFRILFKENERSIAKSRNFLLNEIRGDFFIFVDSDDSVSPVFLSFLVEALERRNSDIACCNYSLVHVFGGNKEITGYQTMVRKLAIKEMILGANGQYMLWNKLIRSDLVKDLKFEQTSFGEDFIFIFELMQKDVNVAFISNKLYAYRYFVNRRKKDVVDLNKRRFLSKLIEMERDERYSEEDRELARTWVVATSMFYLTIAKGFYRHILRRNIRVRKDKVGAVVKSLLTRAVKILFGF